MLALVIRRRYTVTVISTGSMPGTIRVDGRLPLKFAGLNDQKVLHLVVQIFAGLSSGRKSTKSQSFTQ